MKILDLDGNILDWHPSGSKSSSGSKLEQNANELIEKFFPTCIILREVTIPIRSKQYQYLDFYLPLMKIAIEVQGIQHYEYTHFFQSHLLYFHKQKKRDMEKQEWCELNNITLILLPYNKAIEEWRTIILQHIQ